MTCAIAIGDISKYDYQELHSFFWEPSRFYAVVLSHHWSVTLSFSSQLYDWAEVFYLLDYFEIFQMKYKKVVICQYVI